MSITYDWVVAQMDAYPEYEGHTDVVFTVHWRLNGTDGVHTAGVYGSVGLTLDPEAPYTPYADLTEAQVIGWVQDALGEEQVASYETNVAAQIAALVNPPVVTPPLPWPTSEGV
jgi:hypothetical protein